MATLPKALPKAAGPSKMKKAGAGGRSPATSNAHNSRRQSMLILDLQSRKKGVLRQILTTRRELADLDEAEMRETGARRPRPLGVEALRLLAPALARPARQAPQARSRRSAAGV